MAKPITYVGLDVHKDTIAVALAEAGLRGEVREHGKIPNTPTALKTLAMKLASEGRASHRLGRVALVGPIRHKQPGSFLRQCVGRA